MSVTDRLIEFTSVKPTGADRALEIMQLSLLDWAAVTLAAIDEPVAKLVRAMVEQEGGTPNSFAIGLSERVPARAAALVNGVTSHALDYDDTHFASLGHPSVTVIPAAMALADSLNANMEDFQRSTLIGMEASVRIGAWLGRLHYRNGFHITATAGTFGAALACASLLDLNPGQIRNAIGLAASYASGIRCQFGTMGKPYHAGMAAEAGVRAALLASQGFEAAEDGLTGSRGFAETHHGEFNESALDGLGETWIFEQVSHKFHACCHGTHAMLEAISRINSEQRVSPDQVESVEVTVHPQYLKICNIPSPQTGLEAKFSYRFTAAMMMSGMDTSRPDSFSDKICMHSELVALRDRVIVKTDEKFSDTQTRVSITLHDGSTRVSHHDLMDQDPYEVRAEKVKSKAAALIGRPASEAIWNNISAVHSHGRNQLVSDLILNERI